MGQLFHGVINDYDLFIKDNPNLGTNSVVIYCKIKYPCNKEDLMFYGCIHLLIKKGHKPLCKEL